MPSSSLAGWFLTGSNRSITAESLSVTGITGITAFWRTLPYGEKKKTNVSNLCIIHQLCPFSPYITFLKPVIPVIPVMHSGLVVINLLEPVRNRGARGRMKVNMV